MFNHVNHVNHADHTNPVHLVQLVLRHSLVLIYTCFV